MSTWKKIYTHKDQGITIASKDAQYPGVKILIKKLKFDCRKTTADVIVDHAINKCMRVRYSNGIRTPLGATAPTVGVDKEKLDTQLWNERQYEGSLFNLALNSDKSLWTWDMTEMTDKKTKLKVSVPRLTILELIVEVVASNSCDARRVLTKAEIMQQLEEATNTTLKAAQALRKIYGTGLDFEGDELIEFMKVNHNMPVPEETTE